MEITIQELHDTAQNAGIDWINILTQLFAAAIGAGSALFVYYQSDRATKEKDYKQIKSFNKNKLIYLNNLVEQSKLHLVSFKNGLGKFIKELDDSKIEFGTIVFKSTFDLQRIVEKVNQEDHYHAYVAEIKTNEIIEIFNCCDLGYQIIKQLQTELDERKTINQTRKIEIAKKSELARNILVKILRSIPIQDKPNEMHEILRSELRVHLKKFGELKEKSAGDLIKLNNEFIKPLAKSAHEHYQTLQDSPIPELFQICAEINSIVDNAIKNNELLIQELNSDLGTLDDIVKSLDINLQSLRRKASQWSLTGI